MEDLVFIMPRKKAVVELSDDLLVSAEIPLLPVRDTVLFPHMLSPLFVGRDRSIKAIEDAMLRDRTIAVVAQREPEKQDIGSGDLYDIGTEAVIGRMLKMPDGTTNVLVQGQRRIRVMKFDVIDPHYKVMVTPIPEDTEKTT